MCPETQLLLPPPAAAPQHLPCISSCQQPSGNAVSSSSLHLLHLLQPPRRAGCGMQPCFFGMLFSIITFRDEERDFQVPPTLF